MVYFIFHILLFNILWKYQGINFIIYYVLNHVFLNFYYRFFVLFLCDYVIFFCKNFENFIILLLIFHYDFLFIIMNSLNYIFFWNSVIKLLMNFYYCLLLYKNFHSRNLQSIFIELEEIIIKSNSHQVILFLFFIDLLRFYLNE